QTCCIADFQIGGACDDARLAGLETHDTAGLETCATTRLCVAPKNAQPAKIFMHSSTKGRLHDGGDQVGYSGCSGCTNTTEQCRTASARQPEGRTLRRPISGATERIVWPRAADIRARRQRRRRIFLPGPGVSDVVVADASAAHAQAGAERGLQSRERAARFARPAAPRRASGGRRAGGCAVAHQTGGCERGSARRRIGAVADEGELFSGQRSGPVADRRADVWQGSLPTWLSRGGPGLLRESTPA